LNRRTAWNLWTPWNLWDWRWGKWLFSKSSDKNLSFRKWKFSGIYAYGTRKYAILVKQQAWPLKIHSKIWNMKESVTATR